MTFQTKSSLTAFYYDCQQDSVQLSKKLFSHLLCAVLCIATYIYRSPSTNMGASPQSQQQSKDHTGFTGDSQQIPCLIKTTSQISPFWLKNRFHKCFCSQQRNACLAKERKLAPQKLQASPAKSCSPTTSMGTSVKGEIEDGHSIATLPLHGVLLEAGNSWRLVKTCFMYLVDMSLCNEKGSVCSQSLFAERSEQPLHHVLCK